MKFGFNDVCLEHDTGQRHPESADRLVAIRRKLARKHAVEYVEASPATVDDVTAVHDEAYVEDVRSFCNAGGGQWDPDTIAVEETWDAALASAGLATWAAAAAIDGLNDRKTPFALGRPPGHHATADEAMGFCFFNNAAIAAQYVIDQGKADRVAIVDWDVHHGNGTQDIFVDDGDVFYASVHESGLYPGTGRIEETGVGEGEGTTVNVPFPSGAGDAAYARVVDTVLEPLLVEFSPDLVLVSAGFDAHRHDPISRMSVSTDGFGHLTGQLRAIATAVDGALAFVLEGGYGLDTLADGVAMVHEVFDGHVPLEPAGEPSDRASSILDAVRECHGLGSK